MKLSTFMAIINDTLWQKGYPIDIYDLPDRNFCDYFDEEMTEEELRVAAQEVVSDMIYDGDLGDWGDWD